jgi:ABC-type transport system involved in Fe-S cluster assembly fused permease/ATPase subunit
LICDQANAVRLKSCDGLIEFDSVQYRTLKGMTFRCELNTVTTILGISTSERLVFWHLLFRLIDPTAGRIFIDRRNVRDYEIATLRRHVGMVH